MYGIHLANSDVLEFDNEVVGWVNQVISRDFGHFHTRLRRMDRTVVNYIIEAFQQVSTYVMDLQL